MVARNVFVGDVYPKAPFVAPIEADVYPNWRFAAHILEVLEGSHTPAGASSAERPCVLSEGPPIFILNRLRLSEARNERSKQVGLHLPPNKVVLPFLGVFLRDPNCFVVVYLFAVDKRRAWEAFAALGDLYLVGKDEAVKAPFVAIHAAVCCL